MSTEGYSDFRSPGTRIPVDINRGVQNATELNVSDNKQVLQQLEESKIALAQKLRRDFSELVPSLTYENHMTYEEVVDRILNKFQDTKHGLEVLRNSARHEEADESAKEQISELKARLYESEKIRRQDAKEMQHMKHQLSRNQEFVRELQHLREKEAKKILDWQKDVLLYLKRNEAATAAAALPIIRPRSDVVGGLRKYRAENTTDFDNEDDYELELRKERDLSHIEDKLFEILDQGERIYERIMENSHYLRKQLE